MKKSLNQEKLNEQKSFITTWKKANAKGTLVAVTGFGKTTVALLAIEEMNENHPAWTCDVVVPTLTLQKQWLMLIKEWGLKNVTVHVINSYVMQRRKTTLLVLDEIHRYGSEVFGQVFRNTSYAFILGLTATIERTDGNEELIETYAPVLRTITLKEALKNKWVSDFISFNLGISLTHSEQKEYDNINRRFSYYFALFNHDFDKAMKCLNDPLLRERVARGLDKKASEVYVDAINFSRYMRMRKTFLYDAPCKLEAVKEIDAAFTKKMIIFSETASFADKIVETIGIKSFAYHSLVPGKKEMKLRLEKFKTTNDYKVVSAVKAIEEGLDVQDLEMVVLCSGNSTKRQYIQRIGRSLRVHKDKIAIIINLYINGTQDENWLRKRQTSNSVNVFWVNDVAQIRGYVDKVLDGDVGEGTSNINTDIAYTDTNPFTYSL